MVEYGLWKTVKHFLQHADPALESDSHRYLEGFARGRGWDAPAVIAERRDDGNWWPAFKVFTHQTPSYENKQPELYKSYRLNSDGTTVPKHLGDPLMDLSQD
jgi:hypothetical protein